MEDKTHLQVTRYMGEGIFLEDSEGNEEFFTSNKYGCFKVNTADGDVDVAVTQNQHPKHHGTHAYDIFAPRSVRILREELKGT